MAILYRFKDISPKLRNFPTHAYFRPPLSVLPLEFYNDAWAQKLEWRSCRAETDIDDFFSRFDSIHECNRRTDGHTTAIVPGLTRRHAMKTTKYAIIMSTALPNDDVTVTSFKTSSFYEISHATHTKWTPYIYSHWRNHRGGRGGDTSHPIS